MHQLGLWCGWWLEMQTAKLTVFRAGVVELEELQGFGISSGHNGADQIIVDTSLIPALVKKATDIDEHLGSDQQRTAEGLAGFGTSVSAGMVCLRRAMLQVALQQRMAASAFMQHLQ